MVFIGGGAVWHHALAYFRSIEAFELKRKISFWYGARSMRESFYNEEYDMLQSENDNFKWHLALSDPMPEDNWDGLTALSIMYCMTTI